MEFNKGYAQFHETYEMLQENQEEIRRKVINSEITNCFEIAMLLPIRDMMLSNLITCPLN